MDKKKIIIVYHSGVGNTKMVSEKMYQVLSHDYSLNMPRFKLYSILNYPNNLLGKGVTLRIYTHKEKCIKCGKCTRNCPAKSLPKDKEGYPVFLKSKCDKCYRCIHHCPKLALSLSKNKTPKKVLDIN